MTQALHDKAPEPEFSRFVSIADVGSEGARLALEAAPEECARVARRLGIDGLARLQARVVVQPHGRRRHRLRVGFLAEVLQSCVVTLEPVSALVEAGFDVVCAGETGSDLGDVFVEPEGEDPPEPLVDGRVDVGELIVQHLALEIDPYPRRADAAVPARYAAGGEPVAGGGEAEGADDGPFAALRALARGDEGARGR